jgi:uncharacterized membrane protein
VLPRLVIPLAIWGVHALLTRMGGRWQRVAAAVAAAAGSLTNTVLYLGLALVFYILCGIDSASVLTAIAAVAGGAGPLEALAAAIITPPVLKALQKIRI